MNNDYSHITDNVNIVNNERLRLLISKDKVSRTKTNLF